MACGCAVVEADVPGVREMVESDTCLLAEPVPERVTEALRRLVDDEALRLRLAEKAAAALADRSWESSAQQFEQILRKRCFVRAPGSLVSAQSCPEPEPKVRAATAAR
jgi:glycosyltransferase involved in cell wall biosynthesis